MYWLCIIIFLVVGRAGMAELADALDSGSSGRKAVQVQILFPAPPALAGHKAQLC